MNVKKMLVVSAMLNLLIVRATFQQNVAYVLSFPDQSRWGLFNGQGTSGAALAQSAGVSSLQKCTITNNNGTKGIVKGTIGEFQLVPSLQKGVIYWNPLTYINAIQPCLVESFIPTSSQLSQSCQAPEVLLSDNQKIQMSSSNDSPLDKRYTTLTQTADVVFQKEYEQLYGTLKKNLDSFLAIREKMTNRDDFFSVLYLKFAATYGGQFVNQGVLQQLSTSIFGSDIDVSGYFQNGVFPITCDLAVASNIDGQSIQDGGGDFASKSNCGPLMRAATRNLIDNETIDASWVLKQHQHITPQEVQKFLEELSQGISKNNIVYNRAFLTELFFLYLGILMGSNMVVGAPTYDAGFCADNSCPGNSWCPVPSPCEKMNSAPFSFYSYSSHYCFAQLCSKLAAAARYVSILHSTDPKNEYKPQPVDTFYGMIVLNQSSYAIESGITRIEPGQVGMLKGSPGVDIWTANGVNVESNYRYRSVICNLLKASQNRTIELRVEENFDVAHYDPTKIYLPGITMRNGVAKTQKDIVTKGYMQDFFKVDSHVGWAVVLQVVEEQTSSGASSLFLNMVGIARLNPYDFPLVYRGNGLEKLACGSFSAVQLWQAPFLVYTKIVASQQKGGSSWTLGSGNPVPQFFPLGTKTLAPFTVTVPSSTVKTIQPDPINPYYVAYKSALSADFGSKGSLQNCLQNSITTIKKLYFRLNDLAVTPLVTLIKKASTNPHDTIIQITTTEDYRFIS